MCERADDLTREGFDAAVRRRLAAFGVHWDAETVRACVDDSLRDVGVAFGDPAWDWCEAAAADFVNEAILDA